jgi:hypothetical protein
MQSNYDGLVTNALRNNTDKAKKKEGEGKKRPWTVDGWTGLGPFLLLLPPVLYEIQNYK